MEANMVTSILRLPDVKSRTGLSRSTIYLLIKQGSFPKPILLADRAVGWIETEVFNWIDEKIKKSRNNEEIKA